ncbi:MAG: hypothetical protein HY011_09085 [Acidobacteria bacterium]|nr:hypothetical protein [Acidobacteriota bacterium]
MKPYRSLFIILALLLALATPALMHKAFPPAAAQSPNSFAPPADKTELWQIQIYRVKPANMTELTSFLKHELNPARIKGGTKRFDYWATVYGNTTELIAINPMPEGYAQIGQPTAINKALGDGAAALFARAARFYEERLAYVVRYDPALSHTSAKFQGKPDWAILNFLEIAPGQTKAYEDWRKTEFIPADRQGSALARWFTKVRFGGDITRTYLELRLLTSPAEIDQTTPQGAQVQAAMDKLPAGTVARQERRLVRYRPDISIFDGKPVVVAAN